MSNRRSSLINLYSQKINFKKSIHQGSTWFPTVTLFSWKLDQNTVNCRSWTVAQYNHFKKDTMINHLYLFYLYGATPIHTLSRQRSFRRGKRTGIIWRLVLYCNSQTRESWQFKDQPTSPSPHRRHPHGRSKKKGQFGHWSSDFSWLGSDICPQRLQHRCSRVL